MPQVIELAELGQLLDRILIESLEERRSGTFITGSVLVYLDWRRRRSRRRQEKQLRRMDGGWLGLREEIRRLLHILCRPKKSLTSSGLNPVGSVITFGRRINQPSSDGICQRGREDAAGVGGCSRGRGNLFSA